MPTRILLISGSYPPDHCGVGDYTRLLATALAAITDADVSVLTTGTEVAEVEENGVTVCRSLPDWSLRNFGRLRRAIRRVRPDVVHVQYPTQGYRDGGLPWLIPLIAWSNGVRVVQTWHEGFNRRDLARFLPMLSAPGPAVVVRKSFDQHVRTPFGFLARLKRPQYINSAATLPKLDWSLEQIAAVRNRFGAGERRLIAFFGFIHPLKQIEHLFDIANPDTDHIVIVGSADGQADYLNSIAALSCSDRWRGRADIVGFVEPADAAAIVAAADALVLPLKMGGGEWNTSILAGIQEGTFVLTTSTQMRGYDRGSNVYYARIDDIAEMKDALDTYAGTGRAHGDEQDIFAWRSIADRHFALYQSGNKAVSDIELARTSA